MQSRTILLVAVLSAAAARAEEPSLPTFRTTAAALLSSVQHNYFVESELRLPLFRTDPVDIAYNYRETTPFLNEQNPQAALFYVRHELEMDFKLNDELRLISVGGWHLRDQIDRSGSISAYVFGGGIGSPQPGDQRRFDWFILGGGYLSRNEAPADWWLDAHAGWRVVDLGRKTYLQSTNRLWLAFVGDVESANRDDRFQALYKIGPQLQLVTASGNQLDLQYRFYHNDHNPFYGTSDSGILLGIEVSSSLDTNYVFRAPETRESGWLPLVWGEYDVSASGSRRVTRFEMNVELVDCTIDDHLLTAFVWYESRAEYRLGDFDNNAYSVSLGGQTDVGLASALSQGEPLVAGLDLLVHRSDHALDPDPSRVPPSGFINHGSHNLRPRLRLQTLGWNLPYRGTEMYERTTRWLGRVDWRATVGLSGQDDRRRGPAAAQVGLNCDIASVQGCVVYATGIGSVGNETPDWLGEVGVRRPAGKVFARWERYGMIPRIADGGNTWTVGVGINL